MNKPNAQKQKFGSPSLQASLRCQTLAFFATLLIFWSADYNALGQIPELKTPESSNLLPNGLVGNMPTKRVDPTPNFPNYLNGKSIEETNLEIINRDIMQVNQAKINNDLDDYNQNLQRQQLMNFIKSNYLNAYNSIKDMLERKAPLDLKKAVFEVEHAFNNTFTYEQFDKSIQQLVDIINYQSGNTSNNINLNLSILKVMSDTIKIPLTNKEITFTSYPFTYDFEDYYGEKDYNKMFVSKLLATHTGQCHSMPLLHLILAQEIGAEAYLSFSPNHSFIKFKDERGTFYNYETTQGKLVSNEWIMGSGYITANAIKNGIFLDTLNQKQVVAYCLNDLAMGYIKIFGMYDTTFINKCTDLSLKYYPTKNASAYVLKSNMYLAQFIKVKQKYGINSHEELLKNEEAKQYWEKHDYLYNMLTDKGYKNIPKDLYDQWLGSAKDVKSLLDKKQENGSLYQIIK
ncbi:MAG: hypothetical protein JXB17_06610 [Bacteroidales bacterium]|nr:hypothetical protein [Bacteroidales bacterium]